MIHQAFNGRLYKLTRTAAASLAVAVLAVSAALSAGAKDLVILHTNDTHSAIEPDAKGRGGILQRKAIIDSIRRADDNVILVDAGDMVQGSLYFKFFRGDVEYPLADMMGYDIRILGNHEFDNGLKELADHYKTVKGARLSANYDFSATPLRGLFEPYVIRKVDGKKIGFIGLNIDPESLIVKHNYEGLRYNDVVEAANRTAEMLKQKRGCDLVVAVSHIGAVRENDKPIDYDIARSSKYIDIIIGAHSHTVIAPGSKASDHPDMRPGDKKFTPSLVDNADGRPVLVVQTGKGGRYLGYIKIDLDDLKKETPADFDYELIPVTDRFADSQLDQRMKAFIAPYKEKVDSVMRRVIASSYYDLDANQRVGGYPNLAGDFAMWYGWLKADSLRRAGSDIPIPDFGLLNVGGIRQNMPKGYVTEGEVLSTFPFSNNIVLLQLKGSDIAEALSMAAKKGGEGVSAEVKVFIDSTSNVKDIFIGGRRLDPDAVYTVSTLDYVAEGNDDFLSFKRGKILWRDPEEMVAAMMRYIVGFSNVGSPIAPDPTPRFLPEYVAPR